MAVWVGVARGMPVGRWVAVAGERIRVAVGAAIASVAVAEVDRNTVAVAGESGEAGTPLGEAICVTQATSHSAHAPWPIIRTNNRRILSIFRCATSGTVNSATTRLQSFCDLFAG